MRLTWIAIIICITASMLGIVSAEDAAKAPELQVLERFIGEFETVVTVKGSDEKFPSVQSRKWSQGGKFVIGEDQDLPTKKESHFLITYDSKIKQYRACFISEDVTVPLLGAWDEKSQTMTWTSPDIAFKHNGVHRFIDQDHCEWTMTVTSPEGKVVFEVSAKQTRRKN